MTYVSPRWIRLVLPLYALGGLTIGLLLPAMKALALQALGRSGLAVFFVINIAMPALVVALAAMYPRLIVTIVGGLIATIAFLSASGLRPPFGIYWLADFVGQMDPIVRVATVGYLALGAFTVLLLRPFRRVGLAPDPSACSCGYSLVGFQSDRCPECGERRIE